MRTEIPENAIVGISTIVSELMTVCHAFESGISDQFGISVGELRCLELFIKEPTLSIKDLTKRLGVSSSRLSRILDNLEAKGVIVRNIDSKDHRNILVTLTPDGTRLILELKNKIIRIYQPVLEEIDTESCRITVHVLREMIQVFESQLEKNKTMNMENIN